MKRLSLTLLLLIFAVALFPAFCPPDDEALRQGPGLNDIYSHVLFGLTNTFHDVNHNLTWVRTYNTTAGPIGLLPNIPSSLETRAPPA